MVLLGPLLDSLLLLVEFLETVQIDAVNTESLGFFDVLNISDNTSSDLSLTQVRKSKSSRESLVFLWIVVLETDLKLNSFSEFSIFLIKNKFDSFFELCLSDFTKRKDLGLNSDSLYKVKQNCVVGVSVHQRAFKQSVWRDSSTQPSLHKYGVYLEPKYPLTSSLFNK